VTGSFCKFVEFTRAKELINECIYSGMFLTHSVFIQQSGYERFAV